MGHQSFIVFDRSHPSSLAIPLLGRLVTNPEWPFDDYYPPTPPTPDETTLPTTPDDTTLPTSPPHTTTHTTTHTTEQFETGESVTAAALRARKGWCHITHVLNGSAERRHWETYALTSPRLTTLTLLNPDAVLETLSKSAHEFSFSFKSHHRVYLLTALRLAETPRVSRAARRCTTLHGELTAPISATTLEAAHIADISASAQTEGSRGSTSITTAEGEQAFAAQYIEVVVDKGIFRRASVPRLRSKGRFVPGKETLTLFAGPGGSGDGGEGERSVYVKLLEGEV